MRKLHPKAKAIHDLLEANKGNKLSMREIANRLGILSTSSVHHHLQTLKNRNMLKEANLYKYGIEREIGLIVEAHLKELKITLVEEILEAIYSDLDKWLEYKEI